MWKEAYEWFFSIDNNVFTLTPKFDEYISKNCKTQADRDSVRDTLSRLYWGTGKRLDRIGKEAIGNKILREVDLACAKEKSNLKDQTRVFTWVSIGTPKSPTTIDSSTNIKTSVAGKSMVDTIKAAMDPMRWQNI